MTLQRTIKLYRLPEAPLVKGFRQMTKKDVPKAWPLLSEVNFFINYICILKMTRFL